MSVSRALLFVAIGFGLMGCADILSLDGGEPVTDDAGLETQDITDEAGASGDAATVTGEVIDAATLDAADDDRENSDASTLVCPPGKADCNGLAKDGCETNLSDLSHCGSCTNVCGPKSSCIAETCCGAGGAICTSASDCCSANCDPNKHTCH